MSKLDAKRSHAQIHAAVAQRSDRANRLMMLWFRMTSEEQLAELSRLQEIYGPKDRTGDRAGTEPEVPSQPPACHPSAL